MSRNIHIPIHSMTEPWEKRRNTPTGSCVRWKVINGKAVQCGAECEGQTCSDCEARAEATAAKFRGAGRGVSGFLPGY